MTDHLNSRRQLLRFAAMGTLAVPAITVFAESALSYQGNMEQAIAELRTALHSLREATPDKGGHKAKAVTLIEQAIGEVQAGIDFAARKFGD